MPRNKKSVNKAGQALEAKLKGANSKVRLKHLNAKGVKFADGARNANQSRTSGGALTQGYDPNTKQFTRGTTSTRSGRMAEEGSTRAGGTTWTFTQKDENGNTIRQSGRSMTATRRQRYYDVRRGLGMAGG